MEWFDWYYDSIEPTLYTEDSDSYTAADTYCVFPQPGPIDWPPRPSEPTIPPGYIVMHEKTYEQMKGAEDELGAIKLLLGRGWHVGRDL